MTLSRRALLFGLRGPAPMPNDHTSSDADTTPEPMEAPWTRRERARRESTATARVARITPSTCLARAGCSACNERCPEAGAIVLDAGHPRIEEARCTGCGACADACPAPERAIVLLPRLPTVIHATSQSRETKRSP